MSSASPRDARLVAHRIAYAPPHAPRADQLLLTDVSLAVARERVGLIGPNGAGKTTLLRLLAGELHPASGSIERHGRITLLAQQRLPDPSVTLGHALGVADRLDALRRLDQGVGSARDLAVVGDDWDLDDRVAESLARMGLTGFAVDRPLGTLSGGEAARVALARVLLSGSDILLLDEPTNHLDAAHRHALHEFLEQWEGGVLCASHDRALLRRMERIVELTARGARVYGGNYDHYRECRDADDLAAERELASARASLRTIEEEARETRERQARRAARGKRTRAEGGIPTILLNTRRQWAETTTAKVRAITQREVEERRARVDAARAVVESRTRPRFDIASTGLPKGRVVIAIDDLSVEHPGSSGLPLLTDFTLHLVGPERVAVEGPNGSGKSTLLKVVLGDVRPAQGSVRRLPDDEIASLDQQGASLDPTASVLENLRRSHPSMERTALRHTLARFGFEEDAALREVGTLSGGERLRASLACVLGGVRPPQLLLLDEPTNHLDLESQEALEAALRGYDGAMLVVSHDADFLASIGVSRRVSLGSSARSPREPLRTAPS